ncbi:MAG: transposase [Alkalilacustris sp.]
MREVRRKEGRDWDRDTWTGRMALEIPTRPKGSCAPRFLQRRRPADKASLAVIEQASVHGISARSADDLVEAMGRR